MAAPWSRVHLYLSLGPVTKELRRRRRRLLPRVGPGAGESQCRSPVTLLREAPGDAERGESQGWRRPWGRGTAARVCGGETGLGPGEVPRRGLGGGGVGQSPGNGPEVLQRGPCWRRSERFLEEGVPPLGGSWPRRLLGIAFLRRPRLKGPRWEAGSSWEAADI